MKWLKKHISIVMLSDGFIKFEKYLYDENKKTKSISIHYYISSIENLNNYLIEKAEKMRNDGLESFPVGVKINRRILKILK